MAVGALGVATSSIFISLSGASPGTATFFRCVLAVPLLWPLARHERRHEGGLSWRGAVTAAAAGMFFAGDALFWTQAIYEVGAGLTTVLVNAQVVIVPLLALLVDREPVRGVFLAVVPVMVAGILLTGGIVEAGASGSAPVRGTVHAILAAVCYSGFLFLLRRGGRTGRAIQSYRVVLVAAALVALIAGTLWHGVTVTPGWAALGWLALTAVGSQVCGWLLVALSTSHVPSAVSSAILMLTPVGALVLSTLVLGEQATILQLIGCALMLASAYAATASWHRFVATVRRLTARASRDTSTR
jgi:drug/metabolite transporter (DMT)-like permease